MSMKVGLIAGDGNFPLEVAKSIYQQEKKVFIIALKGSASKNIEQYPHLWIRLGQIGKAIKALKENHCEELIIIGGVKKPNVLTIGGQGLAGPSDFSLVVRCGRTVGEGALSDFAFRPAQAK